MLALESQCIPVVIGVPMFRNDDLTKIECNKSPVYGWGPLKGSQDPMRPRNGSKHPFHISMQILCLSDDTNQIFPFKFNCLNFTTH